jgi:photosystem II stability/assembly factor-like uncharacterized protein
MYRISKKYFVALLAIFVLFGGSMHTVTANDEPVWEELANPYTDTEVTFRDIVFINETHGWVVGITTEGIGGGVILHTNDGGNSWQEQHHDTTQAFRQISVVNNNTIWVTGRGGLVYTIDGGQEWKNSTTIGSGTSGLLSLSFINSTHGWTTTNRNLYKTVNGGQTWENVTSWTMDDTARDFFIQNSELWVIGFYGIYYSSDFGNTWSQLFGLGGWSMCFIDSNGAWAVDDEMIAYSFDGLVWNTQPLPRPSPFGAINQPYFSDILFLDSSHGWVCGLETPIAYTPNGGRDWYEQGIELDVRIMALEFLNQSHGWAVGSDGTILRTTHGGVYGTRLWQGLTDYVIMYPLSISLIGTLSAFIVIRHYKGKKRKVDSIGIS